MNKYFTIILTVITLCSSSKAQEIDSLLINEIGVDSLFNLQLELKASQGELSDCDFAIQNATSDFEDGIYTLHSDAFSGYCSCCAVLKQDYNIDWVFETDMFSNEYYECYDSIVSDRFNEKYRYDIFEAARIKADSLAKTDNWIKDAEYEGGIPALLKFMTTGIEIDSSELSVVKTRLLVQIELDSNGKVMNLYVIKGINKAIDKQVMDRLNEMPDWKPAYLYGKPIKQRYTFPINLTYQ